MPAQRPRASFEPIPPDFDLDVLVENTPKFQFVDRISCDMIDEQGLKAFEKLVHLHVVVGGKPLVIDGHQSRLDPWTFSSKWLQDNRGERIEDARDLRKEHLYTPLTIGHYLRNMARLTEQYYEKRENYKDLDRQRVYLKDIDCPEVWHDKLREHLPPNVFYLNDSIGTIGGPGSADEIAPGGGKRKSRGIACAGDLMSSLPPPMRAENMMCYIGHEGTYTPAHREMCASLGHNIMVETSEVLGDDGKPERPGSSIWFMTESKDRHMVSEYWLSILGHDIEVEKHFAQVAAWKRAPFTTYIVEQKVGDFILIPPLAPHQVWNRGTRTMKAAWNRTTVETLEMALKEALPNARMVCRDEQYKNKAIVYFSLQKYSALLAKAKDQEQTAPTPEEATSLRKSPRIKQLRKDFKKLFNLYKAILISETFSPEAPNERNVQFIPFEGNITCAYCRGNIFNRFLSCPTCDDKLGTTEPEPYDVCMECYAMGRSCGCISKLRWTEQFKWKELTGKYEQWRKQYLEIDSGTSNPASPLTLQEEWSNYPKKTLAQVCQEQLKRRPWVDVRKPEANAEDESDNEEIQVNDDGTVKKTKKRRSEAWLKNHHACHVCAHRHEKWKMAECKCGKWWCYGTLFRGHDLMPQQIMEDPNWQCPHCRGVCNAAACRKDPRQKPYEPKGTLLGHDTKKVADARSVESLVDFSVSNLNWLKETTKAPTDNARLKQRQEEAERNKLDDPVDEHDGTDNEEAELGTIEYDQSQVDLQDVTNSLIDPSLRGVEGASFTPINRPNASSVPAVSALLNGDQNEHVSSDYEPAMQSGYVAPEALMYQSSYDTNPRRSTHPAENADADEIITTSSRKRRASSAGNEARHGPQKTRRTDDHGSDGKPLSGATKQFLKEKERHALEEAKKTGRFIITHAKIRGKSKIVKLKVGKEPLAALATRTGQANNDGSNDLLRSDVKAKETEKPVRQAPAPSTKPAKAVRIRIEKDEDFGARKRDRKSTSATLAGPEFEEVDIESDESDGEVEPLPQVDGAFETSGAGRKQRRPSAWQSRRRGDDAQELPEQLPDDWKDGRAGRARNRATAASPPSAPKRATAGKSVAQIRPGKPSGRPTRGRREAVKAAGQDMTDDSEEERREPASIAAAALQHQEDIAANGDGDNDDDNDAVGDNDDDSGVAVKPVASLFNRAMQAMTSGSILSRQKPGGKKIKIVGGKKTS